MQVHTSKGVAVDQTYYWQDMATCPRGCKVQLLSQYGVAVYGNYDGKDKQWVQWAPLPNLRRENEKAKQS